MDILQAPVGITVNLDAEILLEALVPLTRDICRLEITFDKNNGFQIDEIDKNKEIIVGVINDLIDKKIDIKIVKGKLTTKSPLGKVESGEFDLKSAVDDMINKNPIIKDIIDTFDAEPIRLKV